MIEQNHFNHLQLLVAMYIRLKRVFSCHRLSVYMILQWIQGTPLDYSADFVVEERNMSYWTTIILLYTIPMKTSVSISVMI